jgi:hypothetical protein
MSGDAESDGEHISTPEIEAYGESSQVRDVAAAVALALNGATCDQYTILIYTALSPETHRIRRQAIRWGQYKSDRLIASRRKTANSGTLAQPAPPLPPLISLSSAAAGLRAPACLKSGAWTSFPE